MVMVENVAEMFSPVMRKSDVLIGEWATELVTLTVANADHAFIRRPSFALLEGWVVIKQNASFTALSIILHESW
jgi:hypothetical protein